MKRMTAKEGFSMTEVETMITVASWEPRFILGMERTLKQYSPSRLLVYFVHEYAERTIKARNLLKEVAMERQLLLQEHRISFETPDATWRIIEEHLGPSAALDKGSVMVDLTTMPRDVIWSALFWLEASSADVSYIYNRPSSYGSGWLTRNPDDPRLMFKLAGDIRLGCSTVLVAVTGFDADRCLQAVEFYEPSKILIARQEGEQYDNRYRNIGDTFASVSVPQELIEIDAFSPDHGYSRLRKRVDQLAQDHNIILCSFGPKPSGIALFRLQREYPQAALAYIGCKEYSHDYSTGLGDVVEGKLTFLNCTS